MNESLKNVLLAIPKQAQRQDSESEQMRDLVAFANRLGMYDAADYLKVKVLMDGCAEPSRPVNPPLACWQLWEEVDPRSRRQVVVVKIVNEAGVNKAQIRCIKPSNGRFTWARVDRFNGKRGGYKFIRQMTENDF